MPGPVLAGLIAAGSALATNIWNAREARKNREFQERMSSTAHQREVADLRAANINPMMRGLSGASVPGGDRAEMEDVGGRGVATAIAVKQAQAQLELTKAQTTKTMVEARDIENTWSTGRAEILRQQALAGQLSNDQLRGMMPLVLQRARQEIEMLSSSAEASRARAVLDRAAAAGAQNLEEFEKQIGEAGPWVKFFFQLMKGIRGR